MTFDREDFEIQWPRDVLTTELAVLQITSDDDLWKERCNLLVGEAFGPRASRHIEELSIADRRVLLGNVAWGLSTLPTAQDRRPYFDERATGTASGAFSEDELPGEFRRLIERLRTSGYFEHAVPNSIYDSVPGSDAIDSVLERKTRRRALWSDGARNWDGNTLFTLIEVFGELVARPRVAWCDTSSHYLVYGDFNVTTGVALYRFWVNDLLERAGVPYRISEAGSDAGRAVAYSGSFEHEFMEEVASRSVGEAIDKVNHAIGLFRKRDATRADKESAIVELAGVLERRRASMLDVHLRRDEPQLFNILNRFGLRHKRDNQMLDYDDVFLDWVFQRCLSTVALIDRLVQRDAES
jgi:hypothetical protein